MPFGSTSKPRQICWTNKVHVIKKITERIPPSILDENSVLRRRSILPRILKSIQNRCSLFESTHNSTKFLTSMRSDVFTRRSMLRDWIFHGTKVALASTFGLLSTAETPIRRSSTDGRRSGFKRFHVYFHIGIWHTSTLNCGVILHWFWFLL